MNPATETGLFITCAAVAIKTIYELVLILRKNMNSEKVNTGVYCNYPLQGGGCAYASRDFSSMRAVEIINGVQAILTPELERQSGILGEIRDSVKDLNRKDNRL